MKRFMYAAILIIAGLTVPIPALQADEDTYNMDEIIVTGSRAPSPEASYDAVSMDSSRKGAVSTVPDAIDTTAGMDIQRRSVLTPKSSQVKIRGMEEKRSQIMLNGRPLNGTGVMGGYFVDWNSLSIQDIETVEISRGAFSAKYGNNLGGTINMTSSPPSEKLQGKISTGYERYDTFSAAGSVATRQDDYALSLSAGHNRTDGHLRNTEAQRSDASGRLYYFWADDGLMEISLRHSRGNYHMPVENRRDITGYDPDYPVHAGDYLAGPGIKFPGSDRHGDGSFFTKQRTEVDLRAEKTLAGLDAEFGAYLNYEKREDKIFSYETGQKVLEREAVPDRSWGWRSEFSRPGENHETGFGAEGNYQGYGGTDNTFVEPGYFDRPPPEGADDWDATRWHGVYVDDIWSLTEKTDIYTGLRYDDYKGDRNVDTVTGYDENGRPAGFEDREVDFHEGTVSPKLGVSRDIFEYVSVHARAGRAVRFPDNPAFYWYYAGYRPEVDPRTDIKRDDLTYEDAMEYEAGISYSGRSSLAFKLNLYHYRVDDYIRWVFGYPPSRVVYNIERADFTGAEIEIKADLWGPFTGFANFTRQHTEKHGDVLDASNSLSDSLPELPENKLNCGITWQGPDGAAARITLRWVDDREVPYISGSQSPEGTSLFSPAETELKKIDDFLTVDLFFKYPVFKQENATGFVTAGAKNLTDQDYQEEYDFPAPGRSLSIGAELVF
ncbi:MAG: TonB-dependent receptor [Desulfosalsimonas sp.]